MSDLLIRNIPDALKRQIERAARRDGQSLSAKSIDLLRQSLIGESGDTSRNTPSAWDVLRPLLYDGNAEEAEAFAKIMQEVEAERKRDFGRPVDFGADDERES